MICSNCAAENKPGRRFCVRCATPLAAACPSCGAPFDPGDAFCGECAAPLGTGGAPAAANRPPGHAAVAPVAERRLVSVLFADLVAFTPLAEGRDAEETRELLSRYFDTASEVIARYGGTVEKFIGDAVMAVWGAPTAREDDAERAVRAALDLVDAVRGLGPGIQARAGVLTGEAAVTLGATNQGMVAGDLVNTASRLQSAAAPGTVLVGEATQRAASGAIAFEPAGEQSLKGKAAPVLAWRALRVVAQRGGQGRSDLPEPPFVGRDEELRLLKDLIATTGRDRRTRLVSITGPGGIGKSRLAWELEKYIDGITEAIYWHRGRSPSYGEGITFWALGEMVRRRVGLGETDDESATRHRIRATVAEHVPAEDDRRWVEPALLTLLGLEPAPAGGRDVLFAAWRIFFERIAERATTILLFEDLQWADTGLLDFIEHVLEWSKNVPLIVITLARPELLDRRPDWGSATRNLTKLALEPLTDDAMRQLLDGFVPGLPEAAIRAILARADGMPLYAVETVRSLVAGGRLQRDGAAYRPVGELGELAVPDTLRSLIASRLDALDPADRSLVADASLLGQSFTPAGLTAVSGIELELLEPRLRALVRRELFDLEIDPRSPERGQYRFVQSLIREVAYSTLAKRERRVRHLSAARYFEALGEDELAGALASHYLAAHEASADGAEADAVAIQARLALSGASDRAATLGAHDQAVAFLRQAIAITADAAERAGLYLRAASSANAAARHDLAQALVLEGIAVAATLADPTLLGAAEALLGELLIDAGKPPEAVEVLEAAVARLAEASDDEARAGLLGNLSRAYMRSGQPARAIETADLALAIAERRHLDRIIAETLNNKGSSLSYLGRSVEAVALLRAAVDLARERGFVAAETRALSNLGVSIDDNPRRARDILEQGLNLARRVGNRSLSNWAAISRLYAVVSIAEGWDQALAEAAQDLADARAHKVASPLDEIRSLSVQALMRVPRGESTDAMLADLERLAGETTDAFGAAALHYLRGDRALLAGDHALASREMLLASEEPNIGHVFLAGAARAALWGGDVATAREIADRLDATPNSSASFTAGRIAVRAGIAALEGRRDDAMTGFRDALARLRAIGEDFELARTGLDFLLLVGPGEPAARAAATEARPIFERVGARPYLERLDAAAAAATTADTRATA
ncbi:MAG: adenylate/guanylate cyclase domain-containing protein [Candidatus Limnocylindrales bacterium]|nr:adenylate/guanylate cyclase domain-containing protein [Candidatus Limnocylindrales bacterium]